MCCKQQHLLLANETPMRSKLALQSLRFLLHLQINITQSMANTTVFSLNETLFDYAKSNLLQLLVTPHSTYELPRVGEASVTYVQRVTNNTFRTDNNTLIEFFKGCLISSFKASLGDRQVGMDILEHTFAIDCMTHLAEREADLILSKICLLTVSTPSFEVLTNSYLGALDKASSSSRRQSLALKVFLGHALNDSTMVMDYSQLYFDGNFEASTVSSGVFVTGAKHAFNAGDVQTAHDFITETDRGNLVTDPWKLPIYDDIATKITNANNLLVQAGSLIKERIGTPEDCENVLNLVLDHVPNCLQVTDLAKALKRWKRSLKRPRSPRNSSQEHTGTPAKRGRLSMILESLSPRASQK
jgi:hypothetical protein